MEKLSVMELTGLLNSGSVYRSSNPSGQPILLRLCTLRHLTKRSGVTLCYQKGTSRISYYALSLLRSSRPHTSSSFLPLNLTAPARTSTFRNSSSGNPPRRALIASKERILHSFDSKSLRAAFSAMKSNLKVSSQFSLLHGISSQQRPPTQAGRLSRTRSCLSLSPF